MTELEKAARQALEEAYLAGFNDSAEGYNGEYPFQDYGGSPTKDRSWIARRDEYVSRALEQPAYRAVKTWHDGKPVYVAEQPATKAGELGAMKTEFWKQPAQQHIDHCLWARNGNTPCPHVQPAQQGPVAWMDAKGDVYKIEPPEGWCPPHTPLYTSPPASKPWVGLTDEERDAILDREFKQWWSRHDAVCRAIEAKLRKKNGGGV